MATHKLNERLLEGLARLSRQAVSSPGIEEVLNAIVTQISHVNAFQNFTIAHVHNRTRFTVFQNTHQEGAAGATHPLDSVDAMGRVVQTGQLEVLKATQNLPDWLFAPSPVSQNDRVVHLIPIAFQNQVLAVIATASPSQEQSQIRKRIKTLEPLWNLMALILSHFQEGTQASHQKQQKTQQNLARLTRRERQTLQLLTRGHTTKEIASRLGISSKAIETYRRKLRQKLGVSSVAELTKFAIRAGLTDL